ncbi:hypothetical protein CPC08DRAFT_38665 [Agrocybe pediades]|nr:hypothetical protein CPC08DRAFT_38665 [Agrocybe pediades]
MFMLTILYTNILPLGTSSLLPMSFRRCSMIVNRRYSAVLPVHRSLYSSICRCSEDARWRPWNIRHFVEERAQPVARHHLPGRPMKQQASNQPSLPSFSPLSSSMRERYRHASLSDETFSSSLVTVAIIAHYPIFGLARPAALQPTETSKHAELSVTSQWM